MTQIDYSAPIAIELLPSLSTLFLTLGLLSSVTYGITKNSIVNEGLTAILASSLLSVGLLFFFTIVGLSP
ncbi:hypothetical protein K502DRAFT_348351 [Neoconidiobolus thromboides FSU 785]|nr:hypothetical protein K502DRAFT_348351 [Neoconidiobolus thromboides FSU 785]